MNVLIDFLPAVLIIAVIWFLIIKPQMDERREHEKLVSSLAKDDRVVTSSGIHGKVVEVGADTVVIEIAERAKVTFDKNAVVRRAADPSKSKSST